MSKWQSAWLIAKVHWSENGVGFDCACGARDFVMADPDEPAVCDYCGRRYRLLQAFEVTEPSVHFAGNAHSAAPANTPGEAM